MIRNWFDLHDFFNGSRRNVGAVGGAMKAVTSEHAGDNIFLPYDIYIFVLSRIFNLFIYVHL